jgi:hypothetical protein
VCGSVPGCEYGRVEGVGETEAIDMEVMRRRTKTEEARARFVRYGCKYGDLYSTTCRRARHST